MRRQSRVFRPAHRRSDCTISCEYPPAKRPGRWPCWGHEWNGDVLWNERLVVVLLMLREDSLYRYIVPLLTTCISVKSIFFHNFWQRSNPLPWRIGLYQITCGHKKFKRFMASLKIIACFEHLQWQPVKTEQIRTILLIWDSSCFSFFVR